MLAVSAPPPGGRRCALRGLHRAPVAPRLLWRAPARVRSSRAPRVASRPRAPERARRRGTAPWGPWGSTLVRVLDGGGWSPPVRTPRTVRRSAAAAAVGSLSGGDRARRSRRRWGDRWPRGSTRFLNYKRGRRGSCRGGRRGRGHRGSTTPTLAWETIARSRAVGVVQRRGLRRAVGRAVGPRWRPDAASLREKRRCRRAPRARGTTGRPSPHGPGRSRHRRRGPRAGVRALLVRPVDRSTAAPSEPLSRPGSRSAPSPRTWKRAVPALPAASSIPTQLWNSRASPRGRRRSRSGAPGPGPSRTCVLPPGAWRRRPAPRHPPIGRPPRDRGPSPHRRSGAQRVDELQRRPPDPRAAAAVRCASPGARPRRRRR